MKKQIRKASLLLMSLMIAWLSQGGIYANNKFEGNESSWLKKCSVAQKTQADYDDCVAFKNYYQSKQGDVKNQIASLQQQVKEIEGDIAKLQAAIDEQELIIKEIEGRISENKQAIALIDGEIEKLDLKIAQLQASIDARDAIMKKRMQDEQASMGLNVVVEVIMGANDILDMIRRLDGLAQIEAADRQEIALIEAEKDEIDFQRSEQTRLKEEQETYLKQNQLEEQNAIEVKKQQEILQGEFMNVYEKLNDEMRSAKVDLSTLQNNLISINPELAKQEVATIPSNSGLLKPVPGYISANSFHYPNGSIHMGLDIAVDLRTPIYAPANGIILYANNPVPTNSGYIGNRDGYPAGTGNSIQMLCRVNGTTYALSFFHMAQESFAVRAGQSVTAGQLLGLSGNTGNTTGPHCHLEVFNLGNMSMESAIAQFQATADFAWGNGWYATGLTNICDVSSPPCREHPEDVYGYR